MGYVRARFPTLAVTAVLGCAALGGGLLGCGGNDDESEDSGTVATSGGSDEAVAQDAEAKAGARTAQVALEALFTDSLTYDATPEELAELDPSLADVELTVTGDETTYEVTAESESGNSFTVAKDASGATTKSCETEGEGGCPDGGDW